MAINLRKPTIKIPEKIILAYIAGLWDGEGSFFTTISKERGMKRIRVIAKIQMTHKNTIKFVAKKIGWTYYEDKYASWQQNRKKQWRIAIWSVWNVKILIENLLPYLITKHREAQRLLNLIKTHYRI